ncbi:hypothetical protein BSKO_01513 [Bryopsis sp. KO-2023]|nr:hypothetical protein BSKO_01513 [Bryopsis sp. KO-2023]
MNTIYCKAPARASVLSRPRAARCSGVNPARIASRPLCPAFRDLPCVRDVGLKAVKSQDASDTLDAATVQLIADLTAGVDASVKEVVAKHAEEAKLEGVMEGVDSILRKKVLKSIHELQAGLLEREVEVRLLLLAALCGEHLLLLGPPGTAKSELSRRLSGLCGGKYFERLLTRFSVPEELFGPLSMRGLENDVYERKIDGYLPTAEVAFIDEIFKANSAILNALLTLLNERLFDNGNERLEAPLLCLVGASNELPESEELDALYDRFLIRRQVAQVSSGQLSKLARLAAGRKDLAVEELSSDSNGGPVDLDVEKIAMEEFRTAAENAYASVDVPESVVDILTSLRDHLQDKCEPPIYVSDRRFMKAIQLLQVAASADGRSQVNEYDCLLLEHVFGNRPDDAQKVKSFVVETIASDPGLQQSALVFLGLFGRACRVLDNPTDTEIAEATEEVSALVKLLEARHGGIAQTLDGEFPDLRATIWQSEGTVQAAVQSLTPQMTENRKKVVDLLREAKLVEACLKEKTEASVLERLLPKRFKQYKKGISGAA